VLLAGALEDAVEDQEVLAAPHPAWRTSAGVNGLAVGVEIPITVSSLRLRRRNPCIAAIAALMSPPSRSALSR
jgi:hypothetical protein